MSVDGYPHDESRSVSYFGRFGWNWKETYLLNATLRADGSSKFARGNRYGVFPSISAGLTLSNEKFMQNTQNWPDGWDMHPSNQTVPEHHRLFRKCNGYWKR